MRGFTLLELLVVMTIVGILSGLAIPQFRDYRARAFDTRALNDLRVIALAEETYYLDSEHYLSCANSDCLVLPGVARLSGGVEVQVEGDDVRFEAASSHPKGTGKEYIWESDNGGLVE